MHVWNVFYICMQYVGFRYLLAGNVIYNGGFIPVIDCQTWSLWSWLEVMLQAPLCSSPKFADWARLWRCPYCSTWSLGPDVMPSIPRAHPATRMQSSPPGWHDIFRFGNPNLNITLPLESWVGGFDHVWSKPSLVSEGVDPKSITYQLNITTVQVVTTHWLQFGVVHIAVLSHMPCTVCLEGGSGPLHFPQILPASKPKR